ncbi:MAG: META domain-containing protein [Reyranellaceae bacterium]
MKSATIVAATALALALGGCQEEEARLENSAWLVEEIAGAKMQAPVPTLEFRPEGRLGGKASCNNYGGQYKADNGQLELSGLFATKMACAAPLMAQEQALLQALAKGGSYAIEGGSLTITGADGGRILARRVASGKS